MMRASALPSQITPHNCIFLLLNYQTNLASTINSKDLLVLIETALLLLQTAKALKIPIILTTICASTYGGPLIPSLRLALPQKRPIDCNTLNAWEDRTVAAALEKIARRTLIVGGFWTNFSVTLPTLQALRAGYDVYVVADACAELSDHEHAIAVQRMVEAGAVFIDSSQLLLQLGAHQRS